MEEHELTHPVELNLDECLFLDALLDDEEYRIEQVHSDMTPESYPHLERIRTKLFNARLHLKHKSL